MVTVTRRRRRQRQDLDAFWTPGKGSGGVDSFWTWLDDVQPDLARWPLDEMVRLIDSAEGGTDLPDPTREVERAMGRRLTPGEQASVMMKVLAPAGTGPPSPALHSTFARVAGRADSWAVAVVAGALRTGQTTPTDDVEATPTDEDG